MSEDTSMHPGPGDADPRRPQAQDSARRWRVEPHDASAEVGQFAVGVAAALLSTLLLLGTASFASPEPEGPDAAAGVRGDASGESSVERGHDRVRISGGNGCHVPGYSQSGGSTPTVAWLTSCAGQGGWSGAVARGQPALEELEEAFRNLRGCQ